MLANIKFKAIEDLKMIRADGYDYDKFLNDSSDDFPKYEDSVSEASFSAIIKQADDDMNYQEAYGAPDTEFISALNDVLTLASERLDLMQSRGISIGYAPIYDKNRNSVKALKEFLYKHQTKKDA